MKIKIHLLAIGLLLSAFNLPPSTLHAQGALTPTGAPAPTMKTLAQIEPRTAISSAPFIITASGSYYLTTNLTVSGGDAITIATSAVTLDLNGFTITSTDPSATGNGILINSGLRNLAIANGFIQGGVTNNGSGVYSGNGFGYGLHGTPQGVRVSGVSVSGCLNSGIDLANGGDSVVVESSTVRTVGSDGIVATTIRSSVAKDCGNYGIAGSEVTDCSGGGGIGYGLSAGTAQNCFGFSTGNRGLNASTAVNCYGYSESTIGLFATTAQNCYGTSDGSGDGIFAITAQNCVGNSNSGDGLYAFRTAMNCVGTSNTGRGLYAFLVNNCYGESSSDYGIYAFDIAIGSYGKTVSGSAGLRAFIANSCDGNTRDISHPYNMP